MLLPTEDRKSENNTAERKNNAESVEISCDNSPPELTITQALDLAFSRYI